MLYYVDIIIVFINKKCVKPIKKNLKQSKTRLKCYSNFLEQIYNFFM